MRRLLLAITWCAASSAIEVAAQSEDVVFAGAALSNLRSAAAPGIESVKLKSVWLRRDLRAIRDDPPPVDLAALIVPKDSGPASPIVRRIYNDGSTFLNPLTVEPSDVSELRRISSNGLVTLLRSESFGLKPSGQQVAELLATIEALPEPQRAAARRYSGAVLADRGISDPRLSGLVKEFREEAERELVSFVSAREKSQGVEMGQPYAFGSQPITERDLGAIPTDNVADIKVGSETYKRAWLGSSAVIVKPTGRRVSEPKTGVEKLELRPAIEERVRTGTGIQAMTLKSISGKG